MRLRIGKQINTTQVRITALFVGFLLVIAATFGIVNLVSAATVALYTTPVGGDVVTWNGAGTDDNLSNDDNWVGDAAPVDGDTIVLPELTSADQTLVNDLDGSVFLHAIFVQGTNATNKSFTYSITGNAVQIEAGGNVTVSGGSNTLEIATLIGAGDMSINGNGSNGDHDRLVITGSATIGGTLTTPGSATPTNGGEVNGSFTVSGSLSAANTLALATPTALNAAGGSVTISNGSLNVGAGATLIAGDVTIGGSGTSTFAGTQTITGDLTVADGTLALNSAFTTSAPDIDVEVLTVGADVSALVIPSITVTGVTDLSLASPHELAVTTLNVEAANLNVASGATLAATDVTVEGAGTSTFAGTQTIATSLAVPNGTLALNSAFTTSAPAITVDELTVGADVSALVIPSITVTGTADLALTSPNNLEVGTLDVAADLTVAAGATLTATDITVDTDVTFGGTQDVAGDLNVPNGTLALNSVFTGNAPDITANTVTFGTDFTAAPNIKSLTVTTPLTLANDVTLGSVVTTGDLTVSSGATLETTSGTAPTVTVGGNLTLNGALTSTDVVVNGAGSSSFTGTSAPTITGTLAVPNGTLTLGQVFSGTAPAITGNNLIVTAALTSPSIPSIDLTGTLTANNTFTAAGNVTADAITMTSPFVVNGTLTVDGAAGLTVSQNITATTLTVSGGNLTISSNFTGSTVNVTGNVTVNASLTNTAGKTFVVSGDFTANTGYAYFADGTDIDGTVTVKQYYSIRQVLDAVLSLGQLIVENGGSAHLSGTNTFPITFGSGASTVRPALLYNAPSNAFVDSDTVYNNLTLSGAVELENNLSIYIVGNATSGAVTLSGAITYNGFSISKATGTSGKLFIGSSEVSNPVVKNTINDNQIGTSVSVDENLTLTLNGTRGSVAVYNGGVLKGTGKANAIYVLYGGALSPGLSPGTITALDMLNFSDSAIYNVELKSTSSYDKTIVGAENTTCPSTSAVTINENAILAVELYKGYKIGTGDRFTIIDNRSDSDCAVEGTFMGLAEGGLVVAGDGVFSISYVGGDGNDVVLTTITAPTIEKVGVPNTGGQFLSLLNPIVLVGAAVVIAGVVLVAARRRA